MIAANPARALELALSPETAAQLRSIAADASIETRGEWEGTLEASVADDFEHHRSSTRWYLLTPERKFEVYFTEAATRRPGARVRVGGIQAAGRIAAAHVTSGVAPSAAAGAEQCTTTGPQNIAVVMLTMPSNATLPAGFNAASLRQTFFGSLADTHGTDSLNGFWKEMSYGQTSATGQVFGPFRLGQDYTCDQYDEITAAAIQAADATVDWTQFTRIALVFPAASCAYSGRSSIGCETVVSPSKGELTASASWFPVTPDQGAPSVGLYVHELGHALGIGHSSTDDYDHVPLGPLSSPGLAVEYGDPFSLMGSPYHGASTSGQYPAEFKSLFLHWLNPGDYQEVQSTGSFTLAPYEGAAGLRALRVLRDATTNAWLWMEYRQPLGDVDSGLLQALPGSNVFNGALVHYEDFDLDIFHTYVLDFNPVAAPNNFNDAALTPGHSWSDPNSLLTLSVANAASSGLGVTANYDAPCAALQYSSTVFSTGGGSGTVTVTAPSTCAWTASAPADWISLPGATSGQGNGMVQFSVTANGAAEQRNGWITVHRQGTRIVQSGAGVTVLSVSPGKGSGTSGRFTFQFSDAKGTWISTTWASI